MFFLGCLYVFIYDLFQYLYTENCDKLILTNHSWNSIFDLLYETPIFLLLIFLRQSYWWFVVLWIDLMIE